MNSLYVCGELRPSLCIDAATGQLKIYKLSCDADIGDCESIRDQPLLIADLVLQVIE